MLIRMTVEVEAPDEFKGEACLERDALLAGDALLLMHSNELGCTLGKVRVLALESGGKPAPMASIRVKRDPKTGALLRA